MSASTAGFLTLPDPLARSVSDPELRSSGIIRASDAALWIGSGEDRTAVAINYSARTPLPQSLLGGLPEQRRGFLHQTLAAFF